MSTPLLRTPLTIIQPVPPVGTITPAEATSLLTDSGNPLIEPVRPTDQILQIAPRPADVPILNDATAPTTQSVAVTTSDTGAGLLAWAKANPMPAVAIGVGVAWLIYEMTKRKR